jgi:hypothetical protein
MPLSGLLSAAHRNYGSGCLGGFSTRSKVCQYRNLIINYETDHLVLRTAINDTVCLGGSSPRGMACAVSKPYR